MRSCNVPCDKNLIPPTDIQFFDQSSMPIERRTTFTTNNNNCLRPISFLQTTNSKSCVKFTDCRNVRCVGETKRDVDFKRRAFIAFEAIACVSSVVLMAAIEIGTVGWATPALVSPVLGGACSSFKSVSDFIDNIGELFGWW
ncbi:unnamed protein product [Macrosiphum euphorbiae]|nr:unnamed protein product [Macrosiphum euphorbiae]